MKKNLPLICCCRNQLMAKVVEVNQEKSFVNQLLQNMKCNIEELQSIMSSRHQWRPHVYECQANSIYQYYDNICSLFANRKGAGMGSSSVCIIFSRHVILRLSLFSLCNDNASLASNFKVKILEIFAKNVLTIEYTLQLKVYIGRHGKYFDDALNLCE